MSDVRGIGGEARLGWRIRLLLGCYPPWWRVRYDDEMRDTVLALRDEGRWTADGSLDLLRGLVRAWVSPAAIPGDHGMPARERQLIPFAAWGLLLFVLGGAGFGKMLEDSPFTTAADHHPALSWCLTALTVFAIGTAVVMSGAAAVALVALVRSRERGWRSAGPLLAVPASAAACALALTVARHAVSASTSPHARQVGAFVGLVAVLVICGVVCTVAVLRTAVRVPESRAVALSRRVALGSVGGLTTAAALSVVAWTLTAASQAPSLLHTHQGLVSTPTLLTLGVCLVALSSGAGLCLRASLGVRDRHPLSSRGDARRSSR